MKSRIKNFANVALAVTLCLALFAMPVSAHTIDKNDADDLKSEEVTPYGTGYGSIIYPQSTTLRISRGYVDTVSYTGTYGLFGSSGVITLRFTNQSTGDFRSFPFICDNAYHVQKMNIQLTAGTYTVTTIGSNVGNFRQMDISFS